MASTAFWLFTLDINGPTAIPLAAMASLLLAVAFSIAGFWKTDASMDKRYAAVIVPLALSSFIVPYPYNSGPIIAAAALLLSLIMPELKQTWLGMLFSGAVLMVQTLSLAIYYSSAANYHQAGWLSPIISALSTLTGMDAASREGTVLVFAQKNLYPFTVTLEKLGFYPWILILAGAVVLIYLTSEDMRRSLKGILGFLALSLAYLVLRYLILAHALFYSDMPEYAGSRMEIFTNPWWLIASFLPLVLLLIWLYPSRVLKFDFGLKIDKSLAIALFAVMVAVFCLTSAAVYQDPGIKKDGRVLIDEIHSLWEVSTLKLDKDWYGEGSTYNAYSMVEWLDDTYDVDRVVSTSYKDTKFSGATKVVPEIVSDSLTYDILKNYDILIIKTPSQFKPEEMDAIVRFVNDGGGLFLIGDHTNFAGTGTNLNQISKRFGIEFGFDSVNTIVGHLYYYKRGLLPHPIVKYMPSLDFMTGCSLKAPLSSEPAILGFGLSSEPGEYSSVGFFRETRMNDPTHATDTTWGLINQAVALKYGKGRVVAFADSTIVSNFRIFFGGSSNMVIGAMEYLNHKNSYENIKQTLFLLGLIIAALAAYLLGRAAFGDRKMAVLVLVLSLGALSASGALLAFSTKVEETVPSEFYVKDHTVGFDGEHSDIITSQGDDMGQYETFFIWTQRVNLTPSIDFRLEDAMSKANAVVVIDPVRPLSPEGHSSLLRYVKDGHGLLLMVSSEGLWSGIPENFGLETYQIDEPYNSTRDYNKTWTTKDGLPIKPWGLAIRGGKALLTVDGRVVLAEADYGKGKFLLFTDSQVFKNGLYGNPGYMGYSKVAPSDVDKEQYDLRALYDLEYRIFEDYLGLKENSSATKGDNHTGSARPA